VTWTLTQSLDCIPLILNTLPNLSLSGDIRQMEGMASCNFPPKTKAHINVFQSRRNDNGRLPFL